MIIFGLEGDLFFHDMATGLWYLLWLMVESVSD